MASIDIILKDKMTITDVKRAVSELLHTSPEQVCITRDSLEFPENKHVQAMCFLRDLPRGFSHQLTVFWRDTELDKDFHVRATKAFQTDCLFSSDSLNPYEFIIVTPEGTRQKVYIRQPDFDEEEVFVLDE